jgi:hypothetical protein
MFEENVTALDSLDHPVTLLSTVAAGRSTLADE